MVPSSPAPCAELANHWPKGLEVAVGDPGALSCPGLDQLCEVGCLVQRGARRGLVTKAEP